MPFALTSNKKLAIIVQRAGEDIVGGSEGYALAMAKILSERFIVDIITTTAKDHVTWKNEYSIDDVELSASLRIVRHFVDYEREQIWFEMNRLLMHSIPLDEFPFLPYEKRKTFTDRIKKFPLGFGEEWLKREGPFSTGLYGYLLEHQQEYDYVLFMTYLYPTTYFGIDLVKDTRKVYLIPTYHDETPAYLPNFLKYKKYHHLFLTNAEKVIAEQHLYGDAVTNNIIGFGISDMFSKLSFKTINSKEKYILYAGRIEAAKGVHQLFKMFEQYSAKNKDLKLYLIGDGMLKDYQRKNIIYKGFVSEEEKLRYMKDAIAFIHPSAFESLGIVLLESFMMGTPALVNRRSDVLQEHIRNSNAGFSYDNYEEFRDALNRMINDKILYDELQKNAREYFCKHYSIDAYKDRLLKILT